ncbi:MAG: glycosyltransferase family 2 protein, partial [candidate division WOR-3 bacterium]
MALREPLFSVIIPSYNGARLLERCLSSLSHVRYPADRREWIVVDNGSSDGTQTMVRRRFPGTKIIRLPQNLGFTGGIAAGVSAAQGRYLVFLNNDMRVTPQWLEAFDEVLRGQHAVCATGKILDRTGKYVDFIQGILLFDGHALQRFQGARAENFQGLQPHPTFIACGGNMAVRKDVFLSLGGFDRDFFAYTEDVDFSWRLHAAGFQIIFAPEAVTFHDHQATSNRLGRYRRGFLYERNAFA